MGPTVGRMDALPMQEETGLPYASREVQASCACRHDTLDHAAGDRAFSRVRGALPGNVKFIFSGAEPR